MTSFTPAITRRRLLILVGAAAGVKIAPAFASEGVDIASQPYFAGIRRALEGLAKSGAPVAEGDAQALAILARRNDRAAVDAAEKILDRYTLANLEIASNGILQLEPGGASPVLVEQGWRSFLIRIHNQPGGAGTVRIGGTQSFSSLTMVRRPSCPTVTA